jgi:hypothetical protein
VAQRKLSQKAQIAIVRLAASVESLVILEFHGVASESAQFRLPEPEGLIEAIPILV